MKGKAISASEKKARKRMNWPHATAGVAMGAKRSAGVKEANGIYPGSPGVSDAIMPDWKRRKLMAQE